MIVFANDMIRRFVEFISDESIPPVDLFVVPGHDALEVTDAEHDGTVAFGVFDPHRRRIIVPEGITSEDTKTVLGTIAHEYFHHIELVKREEHDEEKAERYASEMVEKYISLCAVEG